MKKRIVLSEIKVNSFTTNLTPHRMHRLRGGLTQSPDCNLTAAAGCSEVDCTDINKCDGGSGCCGPAQV